MKTKMTFSILLAAIVILASCRKEADDLPKEPQTPASVVNVVDDPIAFKPDMDRVNATILKNDMRLAEAGGLAERDCFETAMVPDDFPTIQEAIDAVCDYGDVIVKTGTYTENIVVYKPGLHIKAVGEVTLTGDFFLTPDADQVKIQKFNVVATGEIYWAGIFAFNVEGCEFYQNTFTGTGAEGEIGIIYWLSNNGSIKGNHVSGMEWGILCGTWLDDGYTSNNNMILNNSASGIIGYSCIGLQFNSDYNTIIGNTVVSNPIVNNAGIMLNSWPEGDNSCDHNVIKNNVSSDNGFQGIWVDDGGAHNQIGPNNTANSNAEVGIMLDMYSSDNFVFNNTALDNTVCDIVDEGGTDNTYKNNTAECTDGL